MTRTAPHPPPRPPSRSWRAALSLFTVIPARAPAELDADALARAMFWLPVVGLLLGLIAAGGLALVQVGAQVGVQVGAQAGGLPVLRQLLGAAVGVALLAGL
ncbi:MAG TPA: adenosylcobinamide-GDP ribazoletransferase, partial [Streptosporangiaceae bacterium]